MSNQISNARRLLRDTRGSIMPIFVFSMLPVLAMAGMAMDYGRAAAVKSQLQAALDATALAMSQNANTLSAAALTSQAQGYFSAVFTHPSAINPTINIAYSTANGPQIVATGSTSVKTYFVGLPPISIPTINVSGSSTIAWGSSRLRVALVLDNTGSMADSGKIGALQTATKNLLAQLKAAAVNNGDVYVSIVPFVKDVNVGSSNYNANWIDWTDWNAQNGSCSKSGYTTQSTCQGQGTCSLSGHTSRSACTAAGTCSKSGYTTQSTCVAAGTCTNSHYTTQSTCASHGATWTAATWTAGIWTAATWTPKTHSAANWNGCITDRGLPGVSGALSAGPSPNNYDTNVVAPIPGGTPADLQTQFPAEQYGSCPLQLSGLSYDWTAMNTMVNAMTPNGNTNQAIGLALGWQSLVGGGPFPAPPPMDPSYQYQQVIILLTDGLNTQDRWYSVQASIDARQTMTCNNIMAANITLFTVQVDTGGDPTSTLLQNCASSGGKPDPSKFFLLKTASEIVTTFNTIGTSISKLHIAK